MRLGGTRYEDAGDLGISRIDELLANPSSRGLVLSHSIMDRLITARTDTRTQRPPRWTFQSLAVQCSVYMSSCVPEQQHNSHIGYLKLIESLRIP